MNGTPDGVRKMWAEPANREKILVSRARGRGERRRDKKEMFLAVFSRTGVIKRAIEESGASYSGYHHWMNDDPEFAAQFTALQMATAGIADKHKHPPGVKPSLPRDENIRIQTKLSFLNAFKETGLVRVSCEKAGILVSQHRGWLVTDPDYMLAFSLLYEQVFGRKWEENWRKRPTSIEEIVAVELTERGVDFEGPRIRVDGYNYALDFLIPHLKLNIECDGTYWHDERYFPGRKAHDDRRDDHIRSLGYEVLRLTQDEIEAGDWAKIDAVPL